ncbi:MAG: ABC transporter substrate-binding protein [Candidatus Eisenbacteria bacterium]|nr:ABC transporter substrate-binding protein [Candidatus Eisenbacteria bacterium]
MDPVLRVGHSPDPDDAFMFYALAHGHVKVRNFRIEHVMEDIQTLNERAMRGELEVTAVSAHAFAHLNGRYHVLNSGSSVGRGYGPTVVAPVPRGLNSLMGKKIAVPGLLTTAHLLLSLRLQEWEPVVMPFDQIPDAVIQGRVPAGLIIHEGQLTYREMGLHLVESLGEWWERETRLPLPLGLDIVRADLGEALCAEIGVALHDSVRFARAHEDDALDYAMQFGRGIERETAREFVRMYVNDDTEDMGQEGREALRELWKRGADAGILPAVGDVKFV